MLRLSWMLCVLTLLHAIPVVGQDTLQLTGEQKKWHPIVLTLEGPDTAEEAADNPFRNYRFDVTFSHDETGATYVVPGYFAADGEAATTSASTGNKWRAVFTPGEVGTWRYVTHFREGTDVAVSTDPTAGTANEYDGLSGRFTVRETDKNAPDVRALGFLQYDGTRYFRYADGTRYVGVGPDSPESFLEYTGFDGTVNLSGEDYVRDWDAHVSDWQAGDPTWEGGSAGATKGKGLIGAVNYIASKGMNQQYFITMSVEGDGQAAYPYTPEAASAGRYDVFDVSKLAQWQILLDHMMRKGITAHLLLQEVENELLFEGGDASDVDNLLRKLYYREVVARLGWHPALIWNLGEEQNHTDNSPHGNASSQAQRRSWAAFIRTIDPYDHPITIHNWQHDPSEYEGLYRGFLGADTFEGPSLQWDEGIGEEIRRWHEEAASSGREWVVMMTEYNGGGQGPNDSERARWRKAALWESLMNGAGAVELYFGNAGGVDLTTEDWRPWSNAFDQMRFARTFFEQLPLTQMKVADAVAADAQATYAFAEDGEVYVIYWEDASSVGKLDLRGRTGAYEAQWFNPRTGAYAKAESITGGSVVSLPSPPGNQDLDWAIVVQEAPT